MEEPKIELNEQQIMDLMMEFNNDPVVQQLQSFYQNETVPEIFGVSRREVSHSTFLAWFFNPSSNHGLGDAPLIQLLELYLKYYRSQRKDYDEAAEKLPEEISTAILTRGITVKSVEVITEETVATTKSRGRADIVLLCDVFIPNSQIKKISVIIENKVYSKEHSDQTQTYFDYHQKRRERVDDNTFLEHCLYIFLTPCTTKEGAKCKSFVHLTYQNLLDYIFDRLLDKQDLNKRTRFILTEYVNSLSIPSENLDDTNTTKKGRTIMAIGQKERGLLQLFWEKYNKLFSAALTAMSTDENASEDEKKQVNKTLGLVGELSGKKYYKYKVNGEGRYGCARVVLEVIKLYVNENPNATIESINSAFGFNVAFKWGAAQSTNKRDKYAKRYFEEPVILSDNTNVAVSTQWGNDDRFEKFLRKTRELLPGCNVERIQ